MEEAEDGWKKFSVSLGELDCPHEPWRNNILNFESDPSAGNTRFCLDELQLV